MLGWQMGCLMSSSSLVPWFDCKTETGCSSAASCPLAEPLLNFLLLGLCPL